jgi:metal-responsive CopG/Arc/MetJ family transcriptional regulator
MREVVNISLSKNLNKALESFVKKNGYSTKSEFFRHMIREKLYEADLDYQIKQSKKDLAQGRWKVLKSLKDLR